MASKISQKRKVLEVGKYLGRNRLMAISTSANNKPWSATVFFAYDKNFNILFYSHDETRHCKEIRRNANVSIAVNHTWQRGGGINGLQITGNAKKVGAKDYKKYYALYRKRFKWADRFKADHKLYLVKPREIWLIDEKLFGHFNRVKVI